MSKNASPETKQHVLDLVQYLKQEKLRLTSVARNFLDEMPHDSTIQNCGCTSKAKVFIKNGEYGSETEYQ